MQDEKMHQAVSSAEKTAQSTTERLARAAHQAVDSLSGYGNRTEERVRETSRLAAKRGRQYADQVEGYVNQRPLAAIAIAAGVGVLFGLLMRGR